MAAVRPGVPQPADTAQFRVSMEMTKVDIKNYLEKIYNVPVVAVRTRIQHGAHNRRNHKNQRVKKPDYKVAYVQLHKYKWVICKNCFRLRQINAFVEISLCSILLKKFMYAKGQGQTFQFPNLFPEKEQTPEARSFDDFKNKYLEEEAQRQRGDPRRGGVPDWFGL
uniref:Large ribosomal subunit protein uL23m n=1 Tax=Apteryx owenii TaxID=8824 RepID=A0A8B9NV23_APTOW